MLTLSFAALSHPASAALTPAWTSATSMGGPRTFPVIVQNEDGLVYVMGGVVNGTSWTSVPLANSYDPITGAWTTLAPMSKGLRWATGALGHDGKVYVFAGWNDTDSALYAPVQIYDPVANSWATGASIPTPVSFACAVTLDDGKIYLVGGRDAAYNAVSLVQVYNPILNSWSAGTVLPSARYAGTAVEFRGNIIYSGGYLTGSVPTAEVREYSPGYGWYSLASMPSTRTQLAGVLGGDGILYVMGGNSESSPTSSGFRYNRYTDVWSPLPYLNFGTTYVSSAAYSPDGRVLVMGGTNLTSGLNVRATDRVESLQILTKSITLSASSVHQGGSVLVTIAYEFAYQTPVAYDLGSYLLAGSVVCNPLVIHSPLGGAFSFETNIPQQFAAGSQKIVVYDLSVSFESGGWDLGTTELAITVVGVLSVEEQIAALQTDISALQSALGLSDANVTALRTQVTNLQTQLNALQAQTNASDTSQSAALADLQEKIAALQDQLDKVKTTSESSSMWGMVNLALIIVVIVLLGLMLMMSRKSKASPPPPST
jgi:N-acetylneuraminic acid mutarotase/uncharacterized small protein (DUF1192 family)